MSQCKSVDNIDHNPSSTTARDSFHGTAISLHQHPTFAGEGVDRSITIVGPSGGAGSHRVDYLPHYYTDVPPVTSSIKKSSVPAASVTSLSRNTFKQHAEEEYHWLHHTRLVLESKTEMVENTSWSAYHASR